MGPPEHFVRLLLFFERCLRLEPNLGLFHGNLKPSLLLPETSCLIEFSEHNGKEHIQQD